MNSTNATVTAVLLEAGVDRRREATVRNALKGKGEMPPEYVEALRKAVKVVCERFEQSMLDALN